MYGYYRIEGILRLNNFADRSQSVKILTAKMLIPGSQVFASGIRTRSGQGLGMGLP